MTVLDHLSYVYFHFFLLILISKFLICYDSSINNCFGETIKPTHKKCWFITMLHETNQFLMLMINFKWRNIIYIYFFYIYNRNKKGHFVFFSGNEQKQRRSLFSSFKSEVQQFEHFHSKWVCHLVFWEQVQQSEQTGKKRF